MTRFRIWTAAPLAALLCLAAHQAPARTMSVVTFNSEAGIVFLDSRDSMAAFRLFESLNVPVIDKIIEQTKIFAPEDGTFRIACTGGSADYACAVIVYPGRYAVLDFDTDRVELKLPADIAARYADVFPMSPNGGFHFATEDERLVIDWSPSGLHILGDRKSLGRDI